MDGAQQADHRAISSRNHAQSGAQPWRNNCARLLDRRPAIARRRRPAFGRCARPARNEVRAAACHGRPPCATSAHGVARAVACTMGRRARRRPSVSRGNRHFTVGGGRLRQSGPLPEGRLLRQPALEGLMRSERTDSPRQVGRNKFRRSEVAAAAAQSGGGSGGF
ncbi:hypothetical protein F511_46070 [Dorcoceras hygrometricum]|uniref:Uncharacterized protein n=1 Tax=Dorcoceras hygrometricum TaxID=472368 RepID=A0A2Z6ZUG5_9LAMI|nr:hypothetical protein F511_46070 [Dorcoceras hygrometricum]